MDPHMYMGVCMRVWESIIEQQMLALLTYKATMLGHTQSGSTTRSPIEMPSHQTSNDNMCKPRAVGAGARGDDHTSGREKNHARSLRTGLVQAMEKGAAGHVVLAACTITHSYMLGLRFFIVPVRGGGWIGVWVVG